MAVTASTGDTAGAALDARIAAITAASAAAAAGPDARSQAAHVRELDKTQREAVEHYLARGRISAATILSTLS